MPNPSPPSPAFRWMSPRCCLTRAGRYMVRSRYEVIRGERRRFAHVNVERTDLKPNPEIRQLRQMLGKGYILPAPLLPPERWRSSLLPTPMATTQNILPIAATVYDQTGAEV